jgi:hypothetical protein
MRPKTLVKIGVALVLAATVVPAASPVRAATTAIGAFYAGCGNFSLDVAVSGTNNDGNNVDKFRYLITDGNNKKLYQEDATRPLNTTVGSLVVNLPYDADGVADGGPAKNPIKFSVQDLDGNNNVVATLFTVTYDAPCLSASGPVTRTGIFRPPKNVVGTITANTALYQGPNFGQLNLTARAGASHFVIYRSGDAAWVAIFVGGNDLVWIPASTINANLATVPLPPVRIDGSSLVAAGGSVVPSAPAAGVTARVVVRALRMRSAPSGASAVVTTIPFNTVLPVLGRNAGRTYVKVNFNGTVGWISVFYIRLTGARVAALPVVQ